MTERQAVICAAESAQKTISKVQSLLDSNVDSIVSAIASAINSFVKVIYTKLEIVLQYLKKNEAYTSVLQNNLFGQKGEKLLQLLLLPGTEGFLRKYTILEDKDETKSSSAQSVQTDENKPKKKRKFTLIDENKVEENISYVDVPEDQKICPGCGHKMVNIGYEETFEISIIPAKVVRNIYRKQKYACKECEGADIVDNSEGKSPVITAKLERFYPKSIFSISLIVFIICEKFIDSLPLYRISKALLRYGVDIPRQMLSNAVIYTYKRIKRLYELMGEKIRTLHCLNCDETPFRLLHTSDGKKFRGKKQMWVCCGGRHFKIIYYLAGDRTVSTVAKILGEDFNGALQTDGMKSYEAHCATHSQVVHVACWSHVRRKFIDILKSEKDQERRQALLEGEVGKFLGPINSLFAWEKNLRAQNLSDDAFLARRKEILRPILDALYAEAMIVKIATEVKTRPVTGAVRYMLSLWGC